MIRWLTQPKRLEVSKYVECYWYLEKDRDADSSIRPKLNPDPAAHLIFTLPKQTYQYSMQRGSFKGKGSHWLYPYCNTIELDHSQSFSCIGVKFKVGALYSLTNIPFTQALLNTVEKISTDLFKGTLSIDEKALLFNAKDNQEQCVDRLDALLLPLLLKFNEDKYSKITKQAIQLLSNKPINELGEILLCSQRTVERSFLKVTGFTLKQCQSMNKLEAILEYLYQREQCDIDWGDIAYQFGFSDQPHLIRYLKQQIDLTPQKYAQQRDFAIDIYGGVESK